ncbi:RAIN protein, partial [Vireo altiloquus]|nr:RAIN protein [Vireo altiloquus]
QDFVLYTMTRPQHIFGRPGLGSNPAETPPENPETPQKPDQGPSPVVDTFLSAPDILPRHCLVQTTPGWGGGDPGDPPRTTVRPFRGAAATLNGTPLFRRAPLNPGDLLALGEHILLLYKDPRIGEGAAAAAARPPPWVPPPRPSLGLLGVLGCAGCGRSPQERREELRAALESPKAELRYRPQDEEMLLREILREGFGEGSEPPGGDLGEEGMGGTGRDWEGNGRDWERLGETGMDWEGLGETRRDWEGLGGNGRDWEGNERDWERTGSDWDGLGGTGRGSGGTGRGSGGTGRGSGGTGRGMRGTGSDWDGLGGLPGSFWAQTGPFSGRFPWDFRGPCPELEKDLESCDEALGVLDEVIMSTFQQSVYYLTKVTPKLTWAPQNSPGLPKIHLGTPKLTWAPQNSPGLPKTQLDTPKSTWAVPGHTSWICPNSPQFPPNSPSFAPNPPRFAQIRPNFPQTLPPGSAGPYFQWWVGVRLRTNLDLVLDGLSALGLGDIAGDFFRKLSATANLLCTPRGCLEQATWQRLRAEFPALSPAQLHHLLSHYRLGRGQAPPPAW